MREYKIVEYPEGTFVPFEKKVIWRKFVIDYGYFTSVTSFGTYKEAPRFYSRKRKRV